MAFILAAERDGSGDACATAFARYSEYLAANRARFPSSAYELATSEWYFDFADQRCPHDAWLEAVEISEPSAGARNADRRTSIRVRLLSAAHDGHFEFYYPLAHSYELALTDGIEGHGDWRYDEFRLSEAGHVIHEIEWAGRADRGRWLIEASDVLYSWRPFGADIGAPAT